MSMNSWFYAVSSTLQMAPILFAAYREGGQMHRVRGWF